MEVAQEITIKLRSPAGAELTGAIEVKSLSYSVAYSSSTATLTTDDDGTVILSEGVSEAVFDVLDKVFAKATETAEEVRALDHSTIDAHTPAAIIWSAWAFGKELVVGRSLSLTAVGERDVIASLAPDSNVTSADAASVPSEAATFDDIYDMVHKYAVENQEDLQATVASGELDFGSLDISLEHTGTFGISGGTVTVPCDSTVEAGTRVKSIKTTGTITISEDVDVAGPYEDTNGVAVIFNGLPGGHEAHDPGENHHGVVAAWPQSQGTDDRRNLISGEVVDDDATSIRLILQPDTAYYWVMDAIGFRRSAVNSLDTTSQRSVTGSLEEIVDAQGNDLIPHSLTTSEQAQVDLIDWAADFITIDADGTNDKLSYNAMVYAVEEGQSTEAAQGSLMYPARIEVGRVVFPATGSQKWRAKATVTSGAVSTAINNSGGYSAGDTDIVVDSVTGLIAGNTIIFNAGRSSEEEKVIESIAVSTNTITLENGLDNALTDHAGVTKPEAIPDLQSTGVGKDGSEDAEDFIDFSNGPVKYKAEAPVFASIVGATESDFHTYMESLPVATRQLIADALQQSRFDVLMLAVPNTTKDEYKGSGGGGGSSLTQSAFNSLMEDLTDSIKDAFKADVSALSSTAHGLAALKTLIDAVPTSQSDFDALVDGLPTATKDALKANVAALADSSHGLAALRTLIEGLNNLTTAQIVSAIQAMDASTASGTQTLGAMLDAIKAAVDAIPTDNSLSQSTFDSLVAGLPSDTKDTLKADVTALANSTYGLAALKTLIDGIPTDNAISQSAFDSLVAGLPAATKNALKANVTALANSTYGLAALKALIDAIPTDTAATITQASFNALMSGVTSTIKGGYKANVSILANTTHGLAALKTLIDALPTDNSISQSDFDTLMSGVPDATKGGFKADVSILTSSSHGLAALKSLIDALNDSTAAQIVAAIQAMDASTASGTQTLGYMLKAILDAVGAIPTDNALAQSDFDTLVAGLPSDTKDALKANVTALANATYGLSALKDLIDTIPTDNDIPQSAFNTLVAGLPSATKNAFKANVLALGNSTYGLAALKALIDAIPTDNDISQSDFNALLSGATAAIKSGYKANVTTLSNATYGLSALKTLIDSIPTDNGISQATFDSLMDGVAAAIKADYQADVSSLPTSAQVITALQAMDASTASGTQTLATVLDAIKTAVDAIPTTNPATASEVTSAKDQILTALGNTDGSGEDIAARLASLVTALDDVPTTEAPTTAQIATAISELSILTGVDLKRTLQDLLAVLAGSAKLNSAEDEVTYSDPVSDGVDRVKHTLGDPDGTRTGGLL